MNAKEQFCSPGAHIVAVTSDCPKIAVLLLCLLPACFDEPSATLGSLEKTGARELPLPCLVESSVSFTSLRRL